VGLTPKVEVGQDGSDKKSILTSGLMTMEKVNKVMVPEYIASINTISNIQNNADLYNGGVRLPQGLLPKIEFLQEND
jgi:hypothetical protein